MTLSQLLAHCADTALHPFFGGWVAPIGNNPTRTADGVKLDIMPTDGDVRLRGYYRKVQGTRCDVKPVLIRVVDSGLQTEAAYFASLQPADAQTSTLIPLWTIARLGRKEKWWYAILAAAATNTSQNAMAFMEYYQDRRFDNIDTTDTDAMAVLDGLVTDNLMTEAQADAVKALPTTPVSDFT